MGLESSRLPDEGRSASHGGSVSDEEGPLPFAPLGTLLGVGRDSRQPRRTLVVAERGTRRAAFAVDAIEGLLDLIVKPLPDAIARAPEITGAAELPDGELALTLDAGMLLDRVLLEAPQ
jgi:chemotaxis protein histidine kinase CheA